MFFSDVMKAIHFYATATGSSPIKDFLRELSEQTKRKVAWTLKVIQEVDRVPIEYFKKLSGTDGIWEVRVETLGLAVRLLGFFDGKNFIVLTNGFLKKTDKVPKQEIALAETRKHDYEQRQRKVEP